MNDNNAHKIITARNIFFVIFSSLVLWIVSLLYDNYAQKYKDSFYSEFPIYSKLVRNYSNFQTWLERRFKSISKEWVRYIENNNSIKDIRINPLLANDCFYRLWIGVYKKRDVGEKYTIDFLNLKYSSISQKILISSVMEYLVNYKFYSAKDKLEIKKMLENRLKGLFGEGFKILAFRSKYISKAIPAFYQGYEGYLLWKIFYKNKEPHSFILLFHAKPKNSYLRAIKLLYKNLACKLKVKLAFFKYPVVANKPAKIIVRDRSLGDSFAYNALKQISENVYISQKKHKELIIGNKNFPAINLALYGSNKKWQWVLVQLEPKSGMFAAIFRRIDLVEKRNIIALLAVCLLLIYTLFNNFANRYLSNFYSIKISFGSWFLALSAIPLVLIFTSGYIILEMNFATWKETRIQDIEDEIKRLESMKFTLEREIETKFYSLLSDNYQLANAIYNLNYKNAEFANLDNIIKNISENIGIKLLGYGIYGPYEFGYIKWWKKISQNYVNIISNELYKIAKHWFIKTAIKFPRPEITNYPKVEVRKHLLDTTRYDERYENWQFFRINSVFFGEYDINFYSHIVKVNNVPAYVIFFVFEYSTKLNELIIKKVNEYSSSNHFCKLGIKIISRFSQDKYYPKKNWVRKITSITEDSTLVREASYKSNHIIIYSRPSVAIKNYIICGYSNIEDLYKLRDRFYKIFLLMVILIILYLWLIAFELGSNLTNPLKSMINALNKVRQEDLEVSIYDGRNDELGNSMLALEKMIEELKTKRKLSKFIPPQVLSSVSGGNLDRILGAKLTNISILTSDIRNFTTLCEKYKSDQIFALLNDHIRLMTTAIQSNGGTVIRFIGDAIVALFESDSKANSAIKAINAAMEMNRLHRDYINKRDEKGLFLYNIGIGIATGDAISGILGDEEVRLDYSVLGEIVLKSASLESYSKFSKSTNIIVDENTKQKVINENSKLLECFEKIVCSNNNLGVSEEKYFKDAWQLNIDTYNSFYSENSNPEFSKKIISNFTNFSESTLLIENNKPLESSSNNNTQVYNSSITSYIYNLFNLRKLLILLIPAIIILLEAYSYKEINYLTAIYNAYVELNKLQDDVGYKLNFENYMYDRVFRIVHNYSVKKIDDVSLHINLNELSNEFRNIKFSIHNIHLGKIEYANLELPDHHEIHFILKLINDILIADILDYSYSLSASDKEILLSHKTYKFQDISQRNLILFKKPLTGFLSIYKANHKIKFLAIPLLNYADIRKINKTLYRLQDFIDYKEFLLIKGNILKVLNRWLICWYFEENTLESQSHLNQTKSFDFCKKLLYELTKPKNIGFAIVKNNEIKYKSKNFNVRKMPNIILQKNNLYKVSMSNHVYLISRFGEYGKVILSKSILDYYTRFITKKEIGFLIVWFCVWYFVLLSNDSRYKKSLVFQLTSYFFIASVPLMYITFVFVSKSKLSLINKDYKKILQEISYKANLYDKVLEIDLAWINKVNEYHIKKIFKKFVHYPKSDPISINSKKDIFNDINYKLIEIGHNNLFSMLFLGNGEIYFYMKKPNLETEKKYKSLALYLLSKTIPKIRHVPSNLYPGWHINEAEKILIGTQFEEVVNLLSDVFGEEYLLFNLSSLHFLGHWLTNNVRREFATWNLLNALPKAIGYYISVWSGPFRISQIQYYLFKNRLFVANNYSIGYKIYDDERNFVNNINKEVVVYDYSDSGQIYRNAILNLNVINSYFYESFLRKSKILQKSQVQLINTKHNKSVLITNIIPKLENKTVCYRIPISKIERNVFAIVKIQELFLIILITNVVLVALKSSNELLQPLKDLTQCTIEIIKGNFNVAMNTNYYGEFNDLAISFNNMALAGREGKLIGKFVSPAVIKIASNKISEKEAKNGIIRKSFVLFIGLNEFNSRIRNYNPDVVINELNDYLKLVSRIIRENNGEIDKFIGEKVLVVFNENLFYNCVNACYEIFKQVKMKNNFMLGIPVFGIAYGDVLAGVMGADNQRLEFTIIGDVVNLASRLCSLADELKGGLAIDYRAYATFEKDLLPTLKTKLKFSLLGDIKLKGKEQEVKVVIGLPT